MLSLFRRLHAGDLSYNLLQPDGADDMPRVDGSAASSAARTFTRAHEEALLDLQRIVQSQSSPMHNGRRQVRFDPPESLLLDSKFLSLVMDFHDVRHEAPRLSTQLDRMGSSQAICRESVNLLANLVGRGMLSAERVLSGLTETHEGRAPCLLRLASAAVHDLPLATAMCDLLTALARSSSVGRECLRASLLQLDCPADSRSGDALPQGMRAKYTDFLGRLIGDGQGEWRNDGALYALVRLRDERLLPDRGQVVSQYSTTRWQKQEHFIQLCDALRGRAPWQHPAPPASSIEDLSHCIGALRRSLTTARTDANGALGSTCDKVVGRCVDDALAQGWRLARKQHEALITDQVSLPATGLPAVGEGGPLAELCLPALGRLPKRPPAQVVDRVTAQVLGDPALQGPLARAASSGMSPDCRELVAETARRHVEDALDLSDRLSEFIPVMAVADYRVRLTSDGTLR
ncbi:hypothetical protein CDL60_12750 [Roseateles noduli]|nr:hypothetical protein CDL60_12750 [Roseateles noduli]